MLHSGATQKKESSLALSHSAWAPKPLNLWIWWSICAYHNGSHHNLDWLQEMGWTHRCCLGQMVCIFPTSRGQRISETTPPNLFLGWKVYHPCPKSSIFVKSTANFPGCTTYFQGVPPISRVYHLATVLFSWHLLVSSTFPTSPWKNDPSEYPWSAAIYIPSSW